MKIAVIIPAYNEENRIGAVLNAVKQSRVNTEVIVVDDGSQDSTAQVASSVEGVKVHQLKTNVGKGGALVAGVSLTTADVVVFLDADLMGLKPEHIESLAMPIAENEAEMCIGVFRGGKWNTTLSQIISPNISGQRAIKRDIFLSAPKLDNVRFGVEVKLNKYLKKMNYRVKRVVLRDVTHTLKEHKIGSIRGTFARIRMYYEIAKVYFSKL